MNDSDKQFARAILERPGTVGVCASHVTHGRPWAMLRVHDLRSRWADALRRWLDEPSSDNCATLEHLSEELNARGLGPPYELTREEFARMREAVGPVATAL